jgi:cysteinyl-tRNA synthetase
MSAEAAWRLQEAVLNVQTRALVLRPVGAEAGTESRTELTDLSPADPALAQNWAMAWATQRKQVKAARNFAEADRIRGLLQDAGWEVRDNRDGTVEVRKL